MQTVAKHIGEGMVGVLQSPQPPSAESILTVLLNEISALDHTIILVLDDYHVIDAKPVDDALGFLLKHLPPQLHLVITTREDPPLPLSRLRARGQMTELRAADLRFTDSEAAEFLNTVMGLNLEMEDITALEDRTEGWIAGLQLAAISMQGYQDTTSFIQSFTGSHRFVLDYLVEEVLQQQSARVQTFLLRTSILDRLCGPLCDAVVLDSLASGQETLEYLERSNLFLVPLDDQRRWYRYHHLFADVLRAHLANEHPDKISALHRPASVWYEQNGERYEAIRHAFAGEDFATAADLVELSVPAMARSRQEATLLRWLQALPDEVIQVRPVLSVDYAGTLLQALGDAEGAERWLHGTDDTNDSTEEMVVVNYEGFQRLTGQIAIYRVDQALIRGSVADTLKYADQALDLLPPEDDFRRGAASGLLGLAYWTSGDLESGLRMYTECMARLQRAGFISDTFGCALVIADICLTQGRLRDAMSTYKRALHLRRRPARPHCGALQTCTWA